MNKILLLLLVTLIQSQSDGVLLSGPNQFHKFGGNFEGFHQQEDLDNSESPYSAGLNEEFGQRSHSYRKRSGNDVLMRRSILDKNFMRFGRNAGQSCLHKYCPQFLRLGSQPNRIRFLRFDRGMRDNFIRFGRRAQDNFIRFGRIGSDGNKIYNHHHQGKDYFFPSPEVTNSDKFDGTTDDDFDRIQRGTEDDLRPKADDRNGTDFLPEIFKQDGKDEDGYSGYRSDLDGNDGGNKKNLDVVIRIKRKSNETGKETKEKGTIRKEVGNGANGNRKPERKLLLGKRSADFFDRTPEYFLKKIPVPQYYADKSWENFENLRSQNPPFFPISTNI